MSRGDPVQAILDGKEKPVRLVPVDKNEPRCMKHNHYKVVINNGEIDPACVMRFINTKSGVDRVQLVDDEVVICCNGHLDKSSIMRGVYHCLNIMGVNLPVYSAG